MNRIHIVAVSPRTGSTLLAENMIAAFDIDGFDAHEKPLSHCRCGVNVYLTKLPGDLGIVRPRLITDKHLHVICMMRDPRDVIVSRHANSPERYWVPLSVWKKRVAVLRKLSGHERLSVVRYEDLARSPNDVQRALQQRMPFLRQKHAFSEFHEIAAPSDKSVRALGGLRPIDTSSIGNWRRHLPRVAGQLARHGAITEELSEFGYETDDEWLTALENIEPDFAPSYWPESPVRRRPRAPWRSDFARGWVAAARVAYGRARGLDLA